MEGKESASSGPFYEDPVPHRLGVTIFVTYQLMATKYMTYTFPYMIPIAIGFASYLKKYDRLVVNMAGIVLALYVAVTYLVIIPQCQQASAYGVSQIVRTMADDQTTVVSYGGRYSVSPDLLFRPSVLSLGYG